MHGDHLPTAQQASTPRAEQAGGQQLVVAGAAAAAGRQQQPQLAAIPAANQLLQQADAVLAPEPQLRQ